MLKLYHAPGQLSSRIVWLLEELQADYELVMTHFPKPDGSGTDSHNPHPHGYAPALLHDDALVTETGAIALYLTDLFPHSPLGVPVGHPRRGAYLSWLFYEVGMTEPLLNMQAARLLQHFTPYAWLNDAMWQHLLRTLATQPFLLGENFTVVDILYIGLFERLRAVVGPSDVIDAYIARGDRPARRRALQKGG